MVQTIMVIDDEPNTVELAQVILEMNGFKVDTFTESKSALKALKEGLKPDLILLDIRMPEISGPDFCDAIKKEGLKLKIVFFTASSGLDIIPEKKKKVMGFIFKPFDNDQLVKDVKKFLKA